MRIIGVDPGLRITGYACVDLNHRNALSPSLVEAGVIRLDGARKSIVQRLDELFIDLGDVLDQLGPALMIVEKLYAHYAHPTTAIRMGHARGVILLTAQRRGIRVHELGATEVKKSLTGNGHASKRQMQEAVRAQLNLAETPSPPDVADAIAIALCGGRRIAPTMNASTQPRRPDANDASTAYATFGE